MKNVSIDEIYTKYINGSSVEELSSEYNVSENFIYKGLRNYAKERNIDIKTERRKNKIDMALVYEMHKSGISCEEIGELFNCSYRTIFRRLHEYCEEFNLPFDRKSKEERLMEKISLVYEEYNEGATITELSKKYNCNINIISEALKKYSYQVGKELNIKTGGRKAIKLPIDEIYKKYQSGISAVVLGREYKCSNNTIIRKLREYCEENNLELNIISLELDLPVEEMYNLYASGTSSTILAEKYNCSEGTVVNRIKKYCKQNKIEMPAVPVKKKGNKKIASNVTGEEIYNLYLDGYTIGDIAKSKNLTKRTISEELYAYLEREGKNLKIRSGRKRQELPSEKLYLEYRSGKTMQEIAEEYQSSATTVADRVISYCKANNIPVPKHNIRVNEETSKKIYELSRGGMQQVKIAKETGYGKKKIERILKNEYKKAFLEQLKKMLEEKQIKKETDTNIKVKKY